MENLECNPEQLDQETIPNGSNQLMTPLRLARGGIFLCGVFGIMLTVAQLLPQSAERVFQGLSDSYIAGQISIVLSALAVPTVSILLGLYLIRNADRMARKLFPDLNATSLQIEKAMYRVALLAVSLIIFAETLPNYMGAFGFSIVERHAFSDSIPYVNNTFSRYNVPFLISYLMKIVIACYFFAGAPHIVNWQIQRGREFDLDRNKPEETDPEKAKFQFTIGHLVVTMFFIALAIGLAMNGIRLQQFLMEMSDR